MIVFVVLPHFAMIMVVVVVIIMVMVMVGGRVRVDAVGPLRPSFPLDELSLPLIEMIAKVEREVLGREDFTGSVCGAVVRAASTLGARVEVQDGLPREVFDAGDPDRGRGRVGELACRADDLHELLRILGHRSEPATRR